MKEAILKKLTDKIKRLKYEMNVELPKEIAKAREFGDLSENAEYHAARERQSMVRARIGQYTARFQELSLLDFTRIPKDKVGFGSEVKLIDLETDEEITYRLVIAEEADFTSGKISLSSPIAQSLIGKEEGDEARVKVPNGIREFEILSFKTIHDIKD